MIKYLSLFSGIGAFEKALDRLQIPFELVGYCEIDKYASKAYSLLHKVPESMNFGDITQLDETTLPDDIDLITYGFPCQDISLAGHQKGLLNEDGTPVTDRKGSKKADASLRDYEMVPLKEDIHEYFRREVLPFVPDAWIDESKTKIGYEIPFTRYFYKFTPLRDSSVIMEDIKALETRIQTSLAEVFAE